MLHAFSVCATLGVPASTAVPLAVPSFPATWYSGGQQDLVFNQGGHTLGGGICCSPKDSQCKVRYINTGEDIYERGATQQTRRDSAGTGVVVNWGAKVQKQMGLAPGSTVNSTHKWVCGAACPLAGNWQSELVLGAKEFGVFGKPRDKGKANITQTGAPGGQTKVCEHYTWKDGFLVVPFSEFNFYIDGRYPPHASTALSQTGNPLVPRLSSSLASD